MFALSVRRDERKEIIGSVAKINIGTGIALAAADYEWTLARCILVLGKSPTVILRDKLCSRNTKDDELKKIWQEEIKNSLPALFDKACKRGSNISWKLIKDAKEYRNLLMHGIECSIEDKIGLAVIHIYESACDILYRFALSQGKNIYDRLPPRKSRVRTANSTAKRKYNAQKALKDFCQTHNMLSAGF